MSEKNEETKSDNEAENVTGEKDVKVDKEADKPTIEKEVKVDKEADKATSEKEVKVEKEADKPTIEKEVKVDKEADKATSEKDVKVEKEADKPTIEKEVKVDKEADKPTIEKDAKSDDKLIAELDEDLAEKGSGKKAKDKKAKPAKADKDDKGQNRTPQKGYTEGQRKQISATKLLLIVIASVVGIMLLSTIIGWKKMFAGGGGEDKEVSAPMSLTAGMEKIYGGAGKTISDVRSFTITSFVKSANQQSTWKVEIDENGTKSRQYYSCVTGEDSVEEALITSKDKTYYYKMVKKNGKIILNTKSEVAYKDVVVGAEKDFGIASMKNILGGGVSAFCKLDETKKNVIKEDRYQDFATSGLFAFDTKQFAPSVTEEEIRAKVEQRIKSINIIATAKEVKYVDEDINSELTNVGKTSVDLPTEMQQAALVPFVKE